MSRLSQELLETINTIDEPLVDDDDLDEAYLPDMEGSRTKTLQQLKKLVALVGDLSYQLPDIQRAAGTFSGRDVQRSLAEISRIFGPVTNRSAGEAALMGLISALKRA